MNIIPYNKQNINEQDIRSVNRSLKQTLITTGPLVKKFEDKISDLLNCKYTVSCSSGTAALHLSLMSLNLKKGDVIIMPAINFIAVYNISKFLNLNIFLADVDPLSGQMTPETLVDCIKKNKLKNIKVVITMYLGGYPENINKFYKIKKKLNCYLLEDSCHAFGAKYFDGKSYHYVGSCKHSDISVFSFHAVKTITTGEGGAITTNSNKIYKKILNLRSHGIIKEKKKYWKYQIYNPGLNYRLSDIGCALGLSQLNRMSSFISYRKKIYNYYSKAFSGYKDIINFFEYNKFNKPSYHLFIISLNFKKIKSSKDKLMAFLNKHNFLTQYHYIPIYKFKLYKNFFFLKNSEYYFKNTLSLPIYYNFDLKKQKKIIDLIKIFLRNQRRRPK
jgi:dTDP-4-amino-4,6-dideoxygalactose transaminase